MNYVQKRKLRSRLMIAIISMISCIAVMGVGVYAATQNFEVGIQNEVSLSFSHVDGRIWAKRSGNVIYGTVSADTGISAVTLGQKNADSEGYLLIYDHLQEGDAEYMDLVSANLSEIQEQVNFLTRDNDADGDGIEDITPGTRKISYVFKYEYHTDSIANVLVTLTDTSTKFESNDPRLDKVIRTYKFLFNATDPTESAWESAAVWAHTEGAVGENGNASEVYTTTLVGQNVDSAKPETYTLFVLAELEVDETNSLADAYALGVYDEYLWRFNLKYTPSI